MKRKRNELEEESKLSYESFPGLTVDEVKVNKKRKNSIKCHPLLPQPPFMLLMAAPRFSGKTNLLIKMLIDDDMYCKKFDEIFIWSKSFHNDEKWKAINFDEDYVEEHVFKTYNEAQVQNLFENIQEESIENPRNVLFIFDDMMGDNILSSGRIQTIDRLASTGRHFDISVAVIFQKFMKFSPTTRENATNVVIFEQKNSTALEQIASEYKGSMTLPDFFKVYNFATNEPFSFLHINLQETDPKKRFRKNWNTVITSEKKQDEQKIYEALEGAKAKEPTRKS